MMCAVCRQGEIHPGTTTVTLERAELTFVAKDVLAMVCANCGEKHLDSSTTEQVLRMAEEAAKTLVVARAGAAAEAAPAPGTSGSTYATSPYERHLAAQCHP